MYTWKSYTAHIRHLAADTHFITINKAYRSTVRRDFVKLLKQETLEIMELKLFLSQVIKAESYFIKWLEHKVTV